MGLTLWASRPSDEKGMKAFVTSSYFFPKSKSLGDNSIALVMNINSQLARLPLWLDLTWLSTRLSWPLLNILAENATHSVRVSARYQHITPHMICNIVPIFATAQLLPKLKSLYMIAENGELAKIPFEIPPINKHKVKVCISPLFVNEQWHIFLFSVHVYKHFGAHMHIYITSAIDSFFDLIQEYENEGYLSVQPWINTVFPGVPSNLADPQLQVEFRGQAAAQTDCLLRFKETSDFISFMDFDDVLIPRLAPTYYEEFVKVMHSQPDVSYVTYEKKNHQLEWLSSPQRFSFSKMFKTIQFQTPKETGKIVVNPRLMNHTWIHFPSFLPSHLKNFTVSENAITHLKTVKKVRRFSQQELPIYFNDTKQYLMSEESLSEIDRDVRRMLRKPSVSRIVPRLPKTLFYAKIVSDCYYEKYYFYDATCDVRSCPGPFMCEYPQRDDIKCVHSKSIVSKQTAKYPITYYYPTKKGFSRDMGCFP